MKNIFSSFAVLSVGCALLMVSCEEPAVEENIKPEFPSLVEKTVNAGESVTLTFDADMDWEVSVPENTIQWFWLEDGSFNLPRISGKAADGISVTVGVSAAEEFDQNRSVEVTLTMGGESQVIAKILRPAKEKTLTVYSAVVEDGEIQFNSDGSGYEYETAETDKVELIWTGSDFRLPIKVESNYDWTIKTPSWARLDVPEDAAGIQCVNVYGVPSEYPLENTEGKLQFMSGDEVIKEYTLVIPGCRDIFAYKMNMSITDLEFNYAGQFKVATGFIEGPASGYVYGVDGIRILALTKTEDGGFSGDVPAWLHVDAVKYDASAGSDVLQQRDFTISADVNEGDNRYAAIFFLPPSVDADASDLFSGSDIKSEYVQYYLPVTQLSSDQEFVAMLSNPSDMAAGGATFSVSEDETLYTLFGQSRYAYELIYTDRYAKDNARMMFTTPVTTVRIFDENALEQTSSEDFFLSFSLEENGLGGVADMVSDVKATGYVVLYGASDNVLAVIKCTYNPEEVIEEVADVAFIGNSIEDAVAAGAILENVSDDPAFSTYLEGDALLYHLKYTQPDKPMSISIPASVKKHTVNPYVFRYNISVNGTKYDEDFVNGVLGGVALVDGGVTISMTMPEGRDYLRGNIIFTNSSDETILVLVCTLDLRESAE